MTHQSRLADMSLSAKPPHLKQKRVWVIGIVLLAVPLGLLLIAELLILSSLHKGWTTYKKDNVNALAVDQQGRVWAAVSDGSNGSLVMYPDDSAPIKVPLPGELASGPVSSMAIDRQDRIWVGAFNGLIGMRESSGTWTLYTPENPNGENPFPVWDLVIDGQDRTWAINGVTLVKLDPQAEGHIYTSANSGLADNHVDGIAVDKKGQLWAVSRGELMVLGLDNNWTKYASTPNAGEYMNLRFAIDDQNQAWLGIDPGVMALGPDGVWQPHTLGDPQIANTIIDIVIDNESRVWAASAIQGLFKFEPATGWTIYNQRNSGLVDNNTIALALDGKGQLWVGTFQDGLSRLDPAATLPAQQMQTLVTLGVVAIPAALLSMALVTILVIAFARPGAVSGWIILDFSIAFVGWFIINSLLWTFIRSTASSFEFLNPWVVVPLPVNIVLMILILLAKKRWMALGAFSAFIVNAIGIVLVTAVEVPFSPPPISGILCMFPFFLPFFVAVIASNNGGQKYPH